MDKILYTIEEAASAMSISRSQLYQIMDRQEIRYLQNGRKRLVPATEIHKWIEEQMKATEVANAWPGSRRATAQGKAHSIRKATGTGPR